MEAKDSESDTDIRIETLLTLSRMYTAFDRGVYRIFARGLPYTARDSDDGRLVSFQQKLGLNGEYLRNRILEKLLHDVEMLSIRWDVIVIDEEFCKLHKRLRECFRRILHPFGFNSIQQNEVLRIICGEIPKE